MIKAAKCFLVFVILLFPNLALAGESSVKVNIENNVNTHSSTSINQNSNTDIDISTSDGGNTSVQINNDDFKISGTISSTGSGSFDVSNQKIYNEPSRFSDYSLSGAIEKDKKVTVEGKIIDGKLYAVKIKSEGSSSSSSTPTPTSTATPQPSASSTLQVSPTPTPSPSETPSIPPSASISPSPSPSPLTSPAPQEIIDNLNKAVEVFEDIIKVLVILF